MKADIQKWGNSLAVRIPSFIVKHLGLLNQKKVDMIIQDDKIIITPINYSLEQMLSQITEDNLHDIELDDDSVGREEW